MKSYLSITLALVCVLLTVALVVTNRSANAQHETDAAAIIDYSNRLDAARTHLAIREGRILTLSNHLEACQTASLTLSNQLTQTIALNLEQITNLNQQAAEVKSENQALSQSVMDLTNQVATLTQQITMTKASLAQTNQELVQANIAYNLLEDRLRQDVAERLVVERKFKNRSALETQLNLLKQQPVWELSAERIYAGLNIEVKSNGTLRVISPD